MEKGRVLFIVPIDNDFSVDLSHRELGFVNPDGVLAERADNIESKFTHVNLEVKILRNHHPSDFAFREVLLGKFVVQTKLGCLYSREEIHWCQVRCTDTLSE